ncbi:MAG: pyridoxamine 5'-phosphate oxidase [Bacteroidetes bacterium]|nr:pyridoxamine 5'-phosphate oxidase [Bacteroidota bacterium]
MKSPIADIRSDYRMKSLLEADVAANPFEQFTRWWDEALNSEIDEVNAMTLATASLQGIPSARIVLLKGYDQNGFVFFTNYNSQKGKDIAENPNASLVFFWKELERQVRIDGLIEKIHASESDAYFQSRPAGSRIGAWSSPQSTVIADRSIIENNYVHFEQEFGENYIPRPNHWGGYVVKPIAMEFWQGRSSRMHDRMHYKLNDNHSWTLERLAP